MRIAGLVSTHREAVFAFADESGRMHRLTPDDVIEHLEVRVAPKKFPIAASRGGWAAVTRRPALGSRAGCCGMPARVATSDRCEARLVRGRRRNT